MSLILLVSGPALMAAEEKEQAPDKEEPDHRAGYDDSPRLGGPASTQGQLERDDRVKEPVFRFPKIDKSLEPWFAWKRALNDKYGFRLGVDYNNLYQSISDSLTDDDDAWSSAFRIFGKWTLVGSETKNQGSFIFKVEQRNSIGGKIAPSELGGEAGYVGLTGTLFSDAGLIVVDLNWEQWFNDGKGGFRAGRFDPNDYMNVLGYANPWTTFSNLVALLDATVALPDSSWGFGAAHLIREQWYVLGSINDANGTVTDLGFFEGGAEFFMFAEAGWFPARDDRYKKKASMTVWHVDEREDAGIDSGYGVAVSANWTWQDKWMIFGRAGWSDGNAPLYNRSATLGFGRGFRAYSDVLGLVVNKGQPSDSSLRDQETVELFYRLTLSRNLALTPSVQLLFDPALNPEDDLIWGYGLRLRMSF